MFYSGGELLSQFTGSSSFADQPKEKMSVADLDPEKLLRRCKLMHHATCHAQGQIFCGNAKMLPFCGIYQSVQA